MNAKFTIPYLITGAAMLFAPSKTSGNSNSADNNFRKENTSIHTNVISTPTTPTGTVDSVGNALLANNATNIASRVIVANAAKYDVVYVCDNGVQYKRSGGTRAWRNNNPGCIRYSEFARTMGAIGSAGGFAVFPDENTGMAAIAKLLKSDKYCNLTISDAIIKYAPPHENDTEQYKHKLQKMTGLSINLKIKDLSDAQLQRVVKAIRIIEGWRVGKEIHFNPTAEFGKNINPDNVQNLYAQILHQQNQKTI